MNQLPQAIEVLDAFHVVKLAPQWLTTFAGGRSKTALGHCAHRGEPLFQVRRSLQIGAEHMSGKQVARLNARLGTRIMRSPSLGSAINKSGPSITRPRREWEFVGKILASFPSCPIPEIARLGRTLKSRRQ
ncbi:hypothetical protein CVS30_07870 [Arthrobacter psychrolactophilus]|uniref:Uncharacterized protein n=1 Tax=Arthrobacter psychrolactophilus TaxID=92442 RepID=A0A2V5IU36_9MICC|nr:hypothetical protein CVS30_07870 [Arthrobacter psychrolactophilus]